MQDVGLNKAEQKKRHHQATEGIIIEALKRRVTKSSQIQGYDFIILCVDNEQTRAIITKSCHDLGTPFLDLRSSGRRMIAIPKLSTLKSNLKFIDQNDTEEYSCQEKNDLEQGRISIGNKVVAFIGVQMLLNHSRGQTNIPQTLSV
ncbi:ThiF family adenylyltransferase, partial [Candidatus Woesearchaeota archaeon]|nr:ThiF family adenylyltransferase [Candidatus Woesearchaeota archaeon]